MDILIKKLQKQYIKTEMDNIPEIKFKINEPDKFTFFLSNNSLLEI